jgi:hypothetical protein
MDAEVKDWHGVVRSVRYEAHGSIPPVAATYAAEEPEVVLLEIDHLGVDKELDIDAAKALRACLDKAIAEADGEEHSPHQKPRESPREQPGFPSVPWSAVGTDTNDRAHVYGADGDLVASVAESLPHGETHMDRARLIVNAAGVAEEAKAMGYDPQEAVEALPELLEALEYAEEELSWITDGASSSRIPTEDEAAALHLVRDALASANASGNE